MAVAVLSGRIGGRCSTHEADGEADKELMDQSKDSEPRRSIPPRPSAQRAAAAERTRHWQVLGAAAIASIIGVIAVLSVDTNSEELPANADAPATLAFASAHDGHDHSGVVVIGQDDGDWPVHELGGPIPEPIKENFRLPEDSTVDLVIAISETRWEFEGVLADGTGFWKIYDLESGLTWDAGAPEAAVPFAR